MFERLSAGSNGARMAQRKPASRSLGLAICLAIAGVAQGPRLARAECDSAKALAGKQALLSQRLPQSASVAPTFVIFVNGDGNHFVPPSFGVVTSDFFAAEEVDEHRIVAAAEACRNCNVVLLHVRLPDGCAARAPTAGQDLSSTLTAWSGGRRLASRSTPIVNAADPDVLASLLRLAAQAFPAADLHLVYRGHNFYPDYDPAAQPPIMRPFALTFPGSAYGLGSFAQSLRDGRLSRPLKSVVMASCAMAYYEVASALAPFAESLYASQVDVTESSAVGFSYGFLLGDSPAEASARIGSGLLQLFRRPEKIADAMMEEPLSRIDLIGWPEFCAGLSEFFASAKKLRPFWLEHKIKTNYLDIRVLQAPSDLYLAGECPAARGPECARRLGKAASIAALDPEEIDLGLALDRFAAGESRAAAEAISRLRQRLRKLAQVDSPSSQSINTGLSIRLSALKRIWDEH
jgi:hypothetical protein